MTPINEMTIEQIRAELAGYQPATSSAVVELDAHRERRVRLWRRLDELSGIRRPAAGAPQQRGAQAS